MYTNRGHTPKLDIVYSITPIYHFLMYLMYPPPISIFSEDTRYIIILDIVNEFAAYIGNISAVS